MNNRLNLIGDLEVFAQHSIEQHNLNHEFRKSIYLDLMQRVDTLTSTDFESNEKHQYFLNYKDQMQNRADRHIFEQNATEDDLQVGLFLWMHNYISGIIIWLK